MTSPKLKTIAIFGATSDIAVGCIHAWLKNNNFNFILIGRNKNKIRAIQEDLSIRYPQSIFLSEISELDSSKLIDSIVKKIFKHKIDISLIAHGSLTNQEKSNIDITYYEKEMYINGLSACLISEAIVSQYLNQKKGKLAVIGSVAGDRGRKSNYVYGASKGMLDIYLQGLQHRFYKSNIKICIIKPGPTESSMTSHLNKDKVNLADIKDVAKVITTGINKNKNIIYAPRKWYFIMKIIKLIPSFIFKNLEI
jgi:decaprenylphospho-beta-D-erythro-pentofuranosid-2-ulose 2-reductase